ncbi:hypothetical protein CEXT_762881 [Caerostris extrusa]|uniref:Uncharacterized protein n=1 Tax=Caerostris extrusa TaxID=172846 RepID=A0AAV4X748_CAEEX|nr:hypothetical protein CEXT_762881 [Caerostris extrusa]
MKKVIENYQMELSYHLMYLRPTTVLSTSGAKETIENLATTAQQKIRHHEEQVKLLGSCPKINCNIHSSNNVKEIIDSNSTTNTSILKRCNDCDDEGFKLPPKRNTAKAPICSHSATTQINNKFSQLVNIPINETVGLQPRKFHLSWYVNRKI